MVAKDKDKKKKKDFKLSTQIVTEFEKFAPSRKQTSIVEELIGNWVYQQKKKEQAASLRKTYEKLRAKG